MGPSGIGVTPGGVRDALRAQRFLVLELLVAAAILATGFAAILPFSATPFLVVFGEEFVYRGYLLTRIARVLGDPPRAWLAALVVTSILFGVGHQYQGLSGMITAGLGGFTFGLLYLVTGRNLWVSVIAHGTMDTVGFLLLFLGRYPGA